MLLLLYRSLQGGSRARGEGAVLPEFLFRISAYNYPIRNHIMSHQLQQLRAALQFHFPQASSYQQLLQLPLQVKTLSSAFKVSLYPYGYSHTKSTVLPLGNQLVEDMGILGLESGSAKARQLCSWRESLNEQQIKQILERAYPFPPRVQKYSKQEFQSLGGSRKPFRLPSPSSFIFNLKGDEERPADPLLLQLNSNRHIFFVCGVREESYQLENQIISFNAVYYLASYFPFHSLLLQVLQQAVNLLSRSEADQRCDAISNPRKLSLSFKLVSALQTLNSQAIRPQSSISFGSRSFRLPKAQNMWELSLWGIAQTALANITFDEFNLLFWSVLCEVSVIFLSKSPFLSCSTLLLFYHLLRPFNYACQLMLSSHYKRRQYLQPPMSVLISMGVSARQFSQAVGELPKTLIVDLDNNLYSNQSLVSQARNFIPTQSISKSELSTIYAHFNSYQNWDLNFVASLPQTVTYLGLNSKRKDMKPLLTPFEQRLREVQKKGLILEDSLYSRKAVRALADCIRQLIEQIILKNLCRAPGKQSVGKRQSRELSEGGLLSRFSQTQMFTQFRQEHLDLKLRRISSSQ